MWNRVLFGVGVVWSLAFGAPSAVTPVATGLGSDAAQSASVPTSATYVGSLACRTCHAAVYERWAKTRMANVVRDPREHPDAIIPDLSKPDPLAHLQEGRHRPRLRQQVEAALLHEDRRRLLPVPRAVGRHQQACGGRTVAQPNTDWWVPYYPAETIKRPTGPLCDGCHSVNYDVQDQDGHRVERRLREVPRPRAASTSRRRTGPPSSTRRGSTR